MTPRCEECRREPAVSFSWFADPARWYAPRSGTWKFTGACTSDTEQYYALFRHHGRGWFDSPAERADWSAHLAEKIWFDPVDFAAMLERFRAACGKGRRRARYRLNVKPTPKARAMPKLEPSA